MATAPKKNVDISRAGERTEEEAAQKQQGLSPVAAPAMTMVHGFAIQILAFIPIPKDDLRKQAEIPLLLLDINEGKKSITDLVPHLRGIEFRQQHLGRRVTVDEAAEWKNPKIVTEQEKTDKTGDEDLDKLND